MSKYLIATGGTGGHIFPAVAFANDIYNRDESCLLVVDKRFLKFVHHISCSAPYKVLPSATVSGNIIKKLWALFKITAGILAAIYTIFTYKPKYVISFGGYIAFPTMFAARLLGIPLIVHEQNAIVGRANKFFLEYAKFISTSFPETKGIPAAMKEKVVLTRNPIKPEISNVAKTMPKKLAAHGKICILIIGGSQGARFLSDIVPEAIELLSEDIKRRLLIYQQAREEDADRIRQSYRKYKVFAFVSEFFRDMHTKLAEAHLVIGRGGSATIFELIEARKPGIIIPIPVSHGNHQYLNAKFLEDNGCGWVFNEKTLTPSVLAEKIEKILTKPEILKNTYSNLAKLAKIKKIELVDLLNK